MLLLTRKKNTEVLINHQELMTILEIDAHEKFIRFEIVDKDSQIPFSGIIKLGLGEEVTFIMGDYPLTIKLVNLSTRSQYQATHAKIGFQAPKRINIIRTEVLARDSRQ